MRAAVERAGGDLHGLASPLTACGAAADGRPDLAAVAADAVFQAQAGVTDLRMTHWPLPRESERDIPALVDSAHRN
jgi:hypothetical protein